MEYKPVLNGVTELVGQKTTLVPIQESMAEEWLEALLESKQALWPLMGWDCWDIEAVKGFLGRCVKNRQDGKELGCAVCHKDTGLLLGTLSIMKLDPYAPMGEIGYWMRTSQTGNGYTSDALATMLDFCRDEIKLVRVDAYAAECNHASRRILTKHGFVQEGFKPKSQLCHGTWHDMVMYGRLFEGNLWRYNASSKI